MVVKFLDHNNMELQQQRRRRQRERFKRNRYILAKQKLCTCITLFCTFFAVVSIFLISRTHLWSRWTQKFPFPFSKHWYGPFGFNHPNFANNSTNQMKFNMIDKVWNSANFLFLRNVFGLSSSKNYPTMATRRNDFSLLQKKFGLTELFSWDFFRVKVHQH